MRLIRPRSGDHIQSLQKYLANMARTHIACLTLLFLLVAAAVATPLRDQKWKHLGFADRCALSTSAISQMYADWDAIPSTLYAIQDLETKQIAGDEIANALVSKYFAADFTVTEDWEVVFGPYGPSIQATPTSITRTNRAVFLSKLVSEPIQNAAISMHHQMGFPFCDELEDELTYRVGGSVRTQFRGQNSGFLPSPLNDTVAYPVVVIDRVGESYATVSPVCADSVITTVMDCPVGSIEIRISRLDIGARSMGVSGEPFSFAERTGPMVPYVDFEGHTSNDIVV